MDKLFTRIFNILDVVFQLSVFIVVVGSAGWALFTFFNYLGAIL